MTTLKDKTITIWDAGGLGVEHAVGMGKEVKTCNYFTPYSRAFCKTSDFLLGRGFENTKKVLYFDEAIKDSDMIMLSDIGNGDRTEELRAKGKIVFGGGDAEKFESHRFAFRTLQKSVGLPTQRTVECVGIEDLRKYLKAHPNQYVKADNRFRGDCESFHAKTYDFVEQRINNMEVTFGPYSKVVPFVVEDFIETKVELGLDALWAGSLVRPTLWGFELGRSYLGHYSEELPPFMEEWVEKLKGPLNRRKYLGAMSIEGRVISPEKAYIIDMTMRPAYNLSIGYPSWIKNYPQVVWSVATGEPTAIEPVAPYVGGTPLYCNCEHHSIKWTFPKSLREEGHIKFRECMKVNGNYWAIKDCNSAAFITAWGNSVEDVVSQIQELSEKVDADQMDKTRLKDLDDLVDEIKEARSMGIKF